MPKSFILKKIFIPVLFLFVSTILILAGCSKSDDQKEFENRAHNTPPQKITAMDDHGNQKEEGEHDSDDWRIAPDYAGLINIKPAFPNPVLIGEQFLIEIDFRFIDTVKRIVVYAKDENTLLNKGIPLYESEVSPGLDPIPINSAQFADEVGVGNSNIYRILIYDGNQNLISYGDIKVN